MSWTLHILTIFPDIFSGFLEGSLLGKARDKGLLQVAPVDVRDFADGKHRSTDDTPYGGGAGMIMRVEPVVRALESLGEVNRRILLTPQGEPLRQRHLVELASLESVAVICGRYEGIDERIVEYVDQEISIGDFVLNGGEVAAMVLLDGIVRLLPGVVGNPVSLEHESHADLLLEHPQYTRPAEFRGQKVPEILLSGDHGAVDKWRRRESLLRTRARRPDLWCRFSPTEEDKKLLEDTE